MPSLEGHWKRIAFGSGKGKSYYRAQAYVKEVPELDSALAADMSGPNWLPYLDEFRTWLRAISGSV